MTAETEAAPPTSAQPTAEEFYTARTAALKGASDSPKVDVLPAEPEAVDIPKPEAKAEPEKVEEPKAEEPAKEDGEPEEDKQPEEPKKSRRTLKEENFRLRERNRALTAEAELLRQQRTGAPQQAETPKQPELKRPKQEDFENYDAYSEAMIDWKVDQRMKAEDGKRAQAAAERQLQTQQTESVERFNVSAEKAREKYEDFDESVWDLGYKITGNTAALIAQTDNPAETAYFLSKNPAEAARIAKLPDTKAAIELGKIDAKVAVQAETPKPAPKAEAKPIPETKAPPPTKTVPQGSARPARPLEQLSQNDYYAARQAQFKR